MNITVTSRQDEFSTLPGKTEMKHQVQAAQVGIDAPDFGKRMTLQEKLDFIDIEIRKIHIFCTKSGYSTSQIESFAKPFFARDAHNFSSTIWVSGKAWKRRVVSLAAVIIATVLLFRFDPAYRLACALSKKGAVQILPLWDWTSLYHSRCWVANPLFHSTPGLQLSDCEICEGIEKVRRTKFLSPHELVERHLKRDVPVIVEDGLRDWTLPVNLSIHSLAQTFTEDLTLKRFSSCGFSTNIRARTSDHVDLLKKVKDEGLDNYYAQWENCNLLAARAARTFYKRPYFLPATVSLSHTNWFFISANYSGKIYKPIDVNQAMMIVMQMRGESQVKLEPWAPCNQFCTHFEEIIREGEILVATDFMWKLDYLPPKTRENIAVAVGGSFD